MPELRRLEEYGPFFTNNDKPLDIERLRKLHELVGEFREQFLTNKDLQDLLMNRGYELEEEDRPSSWYELTGGPPTLRVQNARHLTAVEVMMDLATRPRLVALEKTRILIPGKKDETRVITPEGYDAGKVEILQREWMENSDITPTIREYRDLLTASLDEFNLQLVLSMTFNASRSAFIDEKWESGRLQRRTQEIVFPNGYSALDNGYYNFARRKFFHCAATYEKLQESGFARRFTLTQKEAITGKIENR
ncbi:MAG: hypothetical protein AABW73_03060 [Nanoarchaeota archaeon]